MKKALPFFLLIFSVFSSYVDAGEGLNHAMRAKKQQQAVYQQQMQQRALQQGVAQRQQMIQQTALQKQAALRQAALAQEQAAYQATLQQYKQQVLQQQQQAYTQAGAHQAAQVQERLAYQERVQQVAYNQAMGADGYQMRRAQDAAFNQVFGGTPVAETATMADVWKQLESSSHVWSQVIDMDAKELIVIRFMEDHHKEENYIRKSAMHYVQLIDEMSFQNPSILDNPFKNVLQIVAIMEYDFDNGVNADQLARHVLGEQVYQSNLKRLGR